jgi:hypothetical protein
MNQVPEVFPPALQPMEPAVDGPPIEFADELLPCEQDPLPQGVLELLAILAPRRRPVMAGGRAVLTAAMIARGEVTAEGSPVVALAATLERTVSRTGPTLPDPARTRVPPVSAGLVGQEQRVQQPLPVFERPLPMTEARAGEQPVPQVPETSSALAATTSIQGCLNGDMPTSIFGDAQLTLARSVPLTGSTTPPTAPPVPLLEQAVEEDLPMTTRDVLQVPFNKGAVSGQVTVTRTAGESVQHLVLGSDNAQVLEQLRGPFAQEAEPFWQLADSGEEQQQRHDSQPSPEDEQADTGEQSS